VPGAGLTSGDFDASISLDLFNKASTTRSTTPISTPMARATLSGRTAPPSPNGSLTATNLTPNVYVGSVAAGWNLVATGDFTGNGMADLVWFHCAIEH
jgi:hypothetical protein